MNRLKLLWCKLRGSFWFLPTVILASSFFLAVALIEVDVSGSKQWAERWPRIFGAGAAGARGMLSTIAGSMMTVVGVTFSMILVTLALASSQYTSRILRNFMGDRVTQIVLGIFAGIFTYCLIVLRTIRGGDEGGFVPNLAVSVGVVLAIGGIAILIYFLHHIASSIQASSIIASVAEETLTAVDRLFPGKLGEASENDEAQPVPPLGQRQWQAVPASRNGYIQGVDNAAFLRLAREHRTIVRMERGVGDFVVRDTLLVSMCLDMAPDKKMVADLQAAYSIDRYRTVDQDAGFGIRQLVDIALRALSPGVNDTTTGILCIDYLTAILARLASREIPSSYRHEDGELRVITVAPTFASLVAESFNQIRESAGGNVAIMLRMLGALETVASQTPRPGRRLVLSEQAQHIAELAARTLKAPHDRARFELKLARVQNALESFDATKARAGS